MSCGCNGTPTMPYVPNTMVSINPSCVPIHLRGIRVLTKEECEDCPPKADGCAGLCNCGAGGSLARPYGGCYPNGSCGAPTINNRGLGGCPSLCYGVDQCGCEQYPNYPANCHPPRAPFNGGTRVIVRSNLTCNNRATTVHFSCGGAETIPNAYIPDCGVILNGTPKLGCRWGTNPSPESEGMDCPNYLFNHVNPASP